MLFGVGLAALVVVAVVSQVSFGMCATRAERSGDTERARGLRARGVTLFSWFAVAVVVVVVFLAAVALLFVPPI
jgi:hypothetical protein